MLMNLEIYFTNGKQKEVRAEEFAAIPYRQDIIFFENNYCIVNNVVWRKVYGVYCPSIIVTAHEIKKGDIEYDKPKIKTMHTMGSLTSILSLS